jgi:site-specific DNA recombinase
VCGCSLSADRKKGKYTYYHCTGYRGKHGEPYVREEVLNENFAEALDTISIDDEVIEWVMDTIKDETLENMEKHKDTIRKIEQDISEKERKLDILYDDRLDGRIDTRTYDRRIAEIHELIEVKRVKIEELKRQDLSKLPQTAGQALELVKTAHALFLEAPDSEKCTLLQRVVSNCTWSQGEMDVDILQPFAAIADANMAWERMKAENPSVSDLRTVWYP